MSSERTRSRFPPGDALVGVVTVDDQVVFREAAREVIDNTPGFEAIGEAASGEEALALLEHIDPGLVLVDVRMPGMGGVEAARRIRELRPGAVVVLVSVDAPEDVLATASALGTVAFVHKQEFGSRVLRNLLPHGPS